MAIDDRPSIAELQRITRTTCPRCGGPAGACAGAPRTIEEQAEDDAALRTATPLLVEIAAAALAWQAMHGAPRGDRRADSAEAAFLAALAKVRE